MPKYRTALPQLDEASFFLTDGGLETSLIFHEGIDLPHFAACDLLRSAEGTDVLRSYFNRHAAIATRLGVGFILDTATWRANPDWTDRLGYGPDDFERVNRASVRLAEKVRRVWETEHSPIVISAVVGPRGGGRFADDRQTAQQASDYHSWQIDLFADTEADYVSGVTLDYSDEAIGMTRAAKAAGMPIVVSFTVGADGRLASGESVAEAIAAVDADSGWYPAYFAINCAHPTRLRDELLESETVLQRVRGVRANTALATRAEIEASDTLDDGDPDELGRQLRRLREHLPQLTVLGGCCGTDVRHLEAIGRYCASARVD